MDQKLEKGDFVVANGVLATVREIKATDSIVIKEYESGLEATITLADLRIIPKHVMSELETPARLDPSQSIDAVRLIEAGERALIINRFIDNEIGAKQAADLLNIKKSRFYKLVSNYSVHFGPISVVRQIAGPKKGSSRLSETTIGIVEECFEKHYSGKSASYSEVWRQAQARCFELGTIAPGLSAVQRHLKKLDPKILHRKKHGVDATLQIYQPRPGIVFTDHPLHVAQIDHTQVDLLLRAEHDRTVIVGRPWLTLIMDIHTRVILGYYITMFAPSLISVQQCIGMAALPKAMGYYQPDQPHVDYPFYGLPERVLMDNAAEFHSPTLEAALVKYGVKPEWRLKGKKHMGGHIERLIGTLMTTAVHFLPGTTFSNTQQRKDYDSEKLSALTFSEFIAWFSGQIMIYHGTVHAELKKSPKDAWNEYYSGCVDAVPRIITKPHELYIDFLPEVRKPVHNKGILMNAGRYFSYELSKKQGRGQITVKYDPYNLNQIWAKIDDNYINIPRIAAEHKFINYEAYRINRACNQITPPGTITDPNALRQVLKNNNIVKTSKTLTRQAKANKQKQEANMQHNTFINAGLPVTLALPPPITEQQDIPTVSAAVNFSLPPSLFDLKD